MLIFLSGLSLILQKFWKRVETRERIGVDSLFESRASRHGMTAGTTVVSPTEGPPHFQEGSAS